MHLAFLLEIFIDKWSKPIGQSTEIKATAIGWFDTVNSHAIDHVALKAFLHPSTDQQVLQSVVIKCMCECLKPGHFSSLGLGTGYIQPCQWRHWQTVLTFPSTNYVEEIKTGFA